MPGELEDLSSGEFCDLGSYFYRKLRGALVFVLWLFLTFDILRFFTEDFYGYWCRRGLGYVDSLLSFY